MIKSRWLVLLLIALVISAHLRAGGHSHELSTKTHAGYQFKFIKNLGQHKPAILFKCEIPSGNLFLEKNRLVYNFLDLSALAHHHEKENIKINHDRVLNGHCFYVNFLNSNPSCSIVELNKFEEYHNYYLGNDSSKWVSGVPLFQTVMHKELYPSIDMVSSSKEGLLKYEFVVKTGGNPNNIQLQYEGLDKIQIKNGELVLYTSLGQIIEEQPFVYQVIAGKEIEVKSQYVLNKGILSFEFPEGYNELYELVIDPTLIFSTYSGSFASNFGFSATYDSEGFLYSGSIAFSQSYTYPTTPGAFMTSFQGGYDTIGVDIAISKYDTSGTKFIYSTYLGGSQDEAPHSMVVNSRDELYIFGTTGSQNFPVSTKGYQRKMNNPTTANGRVFGGMGFRYNEGADLFVFKLSADGKQNLGSTYIGGSKNDGINDTSVVRSHTLRYNYADEVRGEIDIDNDDNIYVATCTQSSNFPMHGNSFDTSFNGGGQDGIIIKLTSNLDSILWSSYLGGLGKDAIYSLAIDRNNNIYVAGGTTSVDTNQFPSGSHPSHSLSRGGRAEGFITQITADGSSVLNSTFYGTWEYDQIYFVELDRKGFVYVYGQSEDSTDLLIKNALYSKSREGVFISKLSGSLDTTIWSTLIGPGGNTTTLARPSLSPTAFLVDVCNSIYFSGWGGLTNNLTLGGSTYRINNNFSKFVTGMDTTSDAFQKTTDGSDFYLGAIANDASRLTYGSFIGGKLANEHVDGGTSRFDKKGIIYQSVCAGCPTASVRIGSSDFPTKPSSGAVSNVNGAIRTVNPGCNNAVFKMDFKPPSIIAEFQIPRKICLKDSVQLKNFSKVMKTPQYFWDFGNGDTSMKTSPKVFYDSAGTYIIQLVIIDTSSCNYTDTISKKVTVEFPNPAQTLIGDSICIGTSKTLGIALNPNHTFSWSPGKHLDDSTKMNPIASPLSNTTYKLLVKTEICTDTFYQFIKVDSLIKASFTYPDSICIPDSVKLQSSGAVTGNTSYRWFIAGIGSGNQEQTAFEIKTKGNYDVLLIVSDPLSCNLVDTSKTKILALSDSSYTLPKILTCNNDGGTIGLSNVPGYKYRWAPSTGLSDSTISNPSANPKKDLGYMLIIDRGVCTDTVDQRVEFDSIAILTSNDTDICTNSGPIQLWINSFGTSSNFVWSSNIQFSDTLNSSIQDSTISPNATLFRNVYYAKTSSSRGCTAIDSSIIRINNFGIRADTSKSICLGDTVQISVISLIPNDTLLPIWKPYEFIIGKNDTSHILVNPPTDKMYRVDVENRIKCLVSDSVLVQVSSLDRNSASITSSRDTILKNQSSELQALPTGFRYNWNPKHSLSNPNSSSTVASPDSTTTYEVDIFDQRNTRCRTKKSVTIVVEELHCEEPWLFIPNSFSPNNDGANDVFYFRGRHIQEFSLRVYNRWGELLFETNNHNVGWDGIYKGKQAQADVYVYQVRATCLDGQVFEKKGDVTLIR